MVIPATTEAKGKEERHCIVEGCDATQTRDIEKLQAIPHEHDWSDWEVTIPATEDHAGEEERHCKDKDCNETETREIPQLEKTDTYALVDMKLPSNGAYKRHNFVNDDDSLNGKTTAEKLAWGKARYEQAKQYMAGELEEFRQMCEDTQSPYYDPKAAAFYDKYQYFTSNSNYTCGYIDGVIDNEYKSYSRFIAKMEIDLSRIDNFINKYQGKESQNYTEKFKACRHKLEEQAWNDSLGGAKVRNNNNGILSDADLELKQYFGIEDNQCTVDFAATQLDNLLDILTDQDNQQYTKFTIPGKAALQRGINLTLTTSGKHGAHDMTGGEYIVTEEAHIYDTCSIGRFDITTFQGKIGTARFELTAKAQVQNQDYERIC